MIRTNAEVQKEYTICIVATTILAVASYFLSPTACVFVVVTAAVLLLIRIIADQEKNLNRHILCLLVDLKHLITTFMKVKIFMIYIKVILIALVK